MNEIIVQRIRAVRNERQLTQQDLANHLGRTASAISDLERGKVQVSASDLYKLAKLLEKPVEYFYGEDYLGKDVQDLIAIIRNMKPDARTTQVQVIQVLFQMQQISDAVNSTEDEKEQLELARTFYDLFLPYFGILNNWIAHINELKTYIEKLLRIDTVAS